MPNNHGPSIIAAICRKPRLACPPDMLGPAVGTFRAGQNIRKGGKGSGIAFDAGRESAPSVRARNHHNAHVSTPSKAATINNSVHRPKQIARGFRDAGSRNKSKFEDNTTSLL